MYVRRHLVPFPGAQKPVVFHWLFHLLWYLLIKKAKLDYPTHLASRNKKQQLVLTNPFGLLLGGGGGLESRQTFGFWLDYSLKQN